jgi:predicted P-loop ATPase
MTTNFSRIVGLASPVFDGAKVFPVPPDCKDPTGRKNSRGQSVPRIINSWQLDASSDPEQIARWHRENPNCNWGVACAESGLIGVEIDPKALKFARDPGSEQAGFERAIMAWKELCNSWDAPVMRPHVRSRSGGMHFYFRYSDARLLKQRSLVTLPGWQQAVIETRVNGFLIIPPSRFGGQDYTIWPDGADAPYDARAGLIAALSKHTRPDHNETIPIATIKPGSRELEPFLRAMIKVQAAGGFPYDIWRNLLWVVKAEWGEDLARQLAEYLHDGDRKTNYLIERILRDGHNDIQPDDTKIGSILHYMHSVGVHDNVPKTVAAMFGGPVPDVDLIAIAKRVFGEPGGANDIPMTGGQARLGEIGAPIVAAVPIVAPQTGCPQITESPSSLREPLNRAIPGMLADPVAHVDALAVLLCVHEPTFNEVVKLAPTLDVNLVKLRAAELGIQTKRSLTKLSGFERLKNGKADSQNSDNVRVFLTMKKIEFRYNAWLEQIEKREPESQWTKFDLDIDLGELRDEAASTEYGLNGTDALWINAIRTEARKNVVDPAREWLDDLQRKWDGVPRLDSWMHYACGTPIDNHNYYRAVGLALIGGMVQRIRNPGCKFDESVMLIGPQGYGKGELCRALLPNETWFTDDFTFGIESKEIILQLGGKCIVELSEMASRGAVTNQRNKAMLSRQVDRGRTVWSRNVTDRPRRNIFVLSTNEDQPLTDATGGRRYLPGRLERPVDIEWIKANRDQLIGEAAAREARGEAFRPARDVWAIAAEHQEAARERNDAEDHMEAHFGETEMTKNAYVTATDLATLGKLEHWRISNGDRGRVMRKLRFVGGGRDDVRLTVDGQQQRVWVRGTATVRYKVSVNTLTGLPRVIIANEAAA